MTVCLRNHISHLIPTLTKTDRKSTTITLKSHNSNPIALCYTKIIYYFVLFSNPKQHGKSYICSMKEAITEPYTNYE